MRCLIDEFFNEPMMFLIVAVISLALLIAVFIFSDAFYVNYSCGQLAKTTQEYRECLNRR